MPQAETLLTLQLRKRAVETPLETSFVSLESINHFLIGDKRFGNVKPILVMTSFAGVLDQRFVHIDHPVE